MARPKTRQFMVVISHADGGANTLTIRATDATHAAILAKKRNPSLLDTVHGVFRMRLPVDRVRFRAAFQPKY